VKFVVGLLLALVLTTMMTAEVIDMEIFPAEVNGWKLAPEAETYTAETLYRYIDGASELYISYGFKKLLTRRYVKEGQPEITADLFDMGDASNAFGIFAHSQENPDNGIGQDSEYVDGLLRFRQGSCYASLLCSPETPEARAALLALGKRLAGRLPAGAARPEVISLLPDSGLIASSIRYFRHPAWQNTYQFISSENILGIGRDCEAVLAKFSQGEQRPIVLLVLYPDGIAAERAFANLNRAFHLQAKTGAAVQLADKKYFAAFLGKRTVAAVWHAGGAAPAERLLAGMREKIVASGN